MSPTAPVKSVKLGDKLRLPPSPHSGVSVMLVWLETIESDAPALAKPFEILRSAVSGR